MRGAGTPARSAAAFTVATTALLWFVRPEPDSVPLALVAVALATVGFEVATVFYNALLPELAPSSHIGRVSGWGWGLGYVGGIVCLVVLLFGFIGPFAAALQFRYGLRRVTATALIVIATGAALTTQMSQPWQLFLLWGVVVGAGSGCMATVFASTVASRWFVARRGVVTGVLTAATASGQLVFLPMLTWLAERHGWRWVGATVAIATLSVVPVVLLLMRNHPEDVGLRAYGATDDHRPPAMVGSPVANAFGDSVSTTYTRGIGIPEACATSRTIANRCGSCCSEIS